MEGGGGEGNCRRSCSSVELEMEEEEGGDVWCVADGGGGGGDVEEDVGDDV